MLDYVRTSRALKSLEHPGSPLPLRQKSQNTQQIFKKTSSPPTRVVIQDVPAGPVGIPNKLIMKARLDIKQKHLGASCHRSLCK